MNLDSDGNENERDTAQLIPNGTFDDSLDVGAAAIGSRN